MISIKDLKIKFTGAQIQFLLSLVLYSNLKVTRILDSDRNFVKYYYNWWFLLMRREYLEYVLLRQNLNRVGRSFKIFFSLNFISSIFCISWLSGSLFRSILLKLCCHWFREVRSNGKIDNNKKLNWFHSKCKLQEFWLLDPIKILERI